MTTTRLIDWRELVDKADGENRSRDNLYPVVYQFSSGRLMRDSGPQSGIYEGTST